MTHIDLWLRGELREIQVTRVDAVPVAECNLKCEHCFWPHGIKSPKDEIVWEIHADQIAKWDVPVVYAGRTLTKRGECFIDECLARDISIGIVDNGYTIMRREDLLPRYAHINISLDGAQGRMIASAERLVRLIMLGTLSYASKRWDVIQSCPQLSAHGRLTDGMNLKHVFGTSMFLYL